MQTRPIELTVSEAELDMICLGLQQLHATLPGTVALRERLELLFSAKRRRMRNRGR